MKWTKVPFLEAVEDVSRGNIKTLQSDLLNDGRYPVVDQGQDLIAGYVNEPERLCGTPGPVIVFGDHTRAFKYVDFPFCMGADGTKVLRPSNDFDSKYLFHYLRQINLPSAGYSRHFKFLKEIEVPKPPLAEQKRIAAILDAAEALREKRARSSALADQLLDQIFASMFGDPVMNTHGFPILPLIEIVSGSRPITYGILKPGDDVDGGVPYVRVVDMKNSRIAVEGLKRTTQEISNAYRRSLLAAGDLLMSIRGHVGRVVSVPRDAEGANITQDTARIAVAGADPTYVQYVLRHRAIQQWMARHTKGVAVTGINLTDVKRIPIPLPPRQHQEAFAAAAMHVEKHLDTLKESRQYISALHTSLTRAAFAGKV